jgi:hypothetical protein
MRRALYSVLLLTAAFSLTAAAATPCKPKLDHRKLDQTAIGNLQVQKVNSWKEEWRMDPKKTAQHEVVSAPLTQTLFRSVDAVPVTFVKGDDRAQVFAYSEDGRKVEVTMKKPEWLLPYSGIYKIMMWVVTDVKTTCTK